MIDSSFEKLHKVKNLKHHIFFTIPIKILEKTELLKVEITKEMRVIRALAKNAVSIDIDEINFRRQENKAQGGFQKIRLAIFNSRGP